MVFNSLMDNILCHYPETVTKMSPWQNAFSALHRLKLSTVWGGLFGRQTPRLVGAVILNRPIES